jgi:hypothetical protein
MEKASRAETGKGSLGAAWARELKALQRSQGSGKLNSSIEQILAEDRDDRLLARPRGSGCQC